MTEVYFQDTTIRDGAQSLWAYNIRTGMIEPICEYLDEAGFEAIELGGPIEIPKCVKELHEDPWERYRRVIPKFRRTPLRLVHGTRSGFAIYPHALHQLFVDLGILDGDVYGPNVPIMFGLTATQLTTDGKQIVPAEKYGIQIVLFWEIEKYLQPTKMPAIWVVPAAARFR